jgi:hypothetical protein
MIFTFSRELALVAQEVHDVLLDSQSYACISREFHKESPFRNLTPIDKCRPLKTKVFIPKTLANTTYFEGHRFINVKEYTGVQTQSSGSGLGNLEK